MEKFEKYYWKFFLNDNNEVEVYNLRQDNVVGYLPGLELSYVKEITENMSEQHISDFIISCIEYY